jgi:hypothetical protein
MVGGLGLESYANPVCSLRWLTESGAGRTASGGMLPVLGRPSVRVEETLRRWHQNTNAQHARSDDAVAYRRVRPAERPRGKTRAQQTAPEAST